MRADSPEYIQAATASSREPRFVAFVQVSELEELILTSHDDIPSIPAGAINNVFKDFSSVSQTIDPNTGSSRIGRLTVSVVDLAEAVSTAMRSLNTNGFGLRGKPMRLYKGYKGLDWTNFALRYTQVIKDIDVAKGGTIRFICNDQQRALRSQLFTKKVTRLAGALNIGDGTVDVLDTSDFDLVAHGISYSHGPSASWGYIKIEDEIIGYQAKTGTSFVTIERGLFNTVEADHEFNGADPEERWLEVEEYVYLELPAIKLAYSLITGDLLSASNTLPEGWHLGVDPTLVDLTQFQNIGSDLWDTTNDAAGFILRFNGLEPTDGKKFLEEQIYLLTQVFSPILSDGRIGLKRLVPALAGAAAQAQLSNLNVISHGAMKHDMSALINRVAISWSKVGDDFRRTNILIDADSITKHGAANLKRFEFEGLSSSLYTSSAISQIFNSLRERYANPPLRLTAKAFSSLDRLEIGDPVFANLDSVRDYSNDSSTKLRRTFEIHQIKESRAGGISLSLFGSSSNADPIDPEAPSNPLPDTYYDQSGTELSTVVTIASGVTAAGTFNLTGNASLKAGVYYFLGDLTIADGTILEIDENVTLRIRGGLTINGEIRGVGAGHAGVSDAAAIGAGPGGTPGFFGSTAASDGIESTIIDLAREGINQLLQTRPPDTPSTVGQYPAVPNFNLSVDGITINGCPDDLRGTSGGPGGKLINNDDTVVAQGSTGGAGGAGLLLVCRALSFGLTAVVDLSGGDGAQPGATSVLDGRPAYPGTGAGGAPGAFVVLIDGSTVLPDILSAFVANGGLTDPVGNTMPLPAFNDPSPGPGDAELTGFYDPARVISGQDYALAAYRVQFIPFPETPVEDLPEAEDSSSTVIVVLSNETQSLTADNSGAVASFAEANGLLTVLQGLSNVTNLATLSVIEQTNCTGTVNTAVDTPVSGQPKGYYEVDSMTADNARLGLRAVYSGLQLDVVFTLSKSIEGDDGSGGTAAKQVNLSASDLLFKFDGNDVLIGPTQVVLTASRQNISSAITWSSTPASLLTGVSGDTANLTAASFGSLDSVTVRAEAEGEFEERTIQRVRDGSAGADGSNGQDGSNGADGADGSDGAPGADGSDGADGQDGADGRPAILSDAGWVEPPTDNMGLWVRRSGILANSSVLSNFFGPFGTVPKVLRIRGNSVVAGWLGFWSHELPVTDLNSFVVYTWVQRRSADTNRGLYIGWYDTTGALAVVQNLGTFTDNTNPYAISNQAAVMDVGKWYLAAAIVHPSDYTGPTTNTGGIFDPDTGEQILTGTEFRVKAGEGRLAYRMGYYDNTEAKTTDEGFLFTRPIGYQIDGTEPGVSEILQGLRIFGKIDVSDNLTWSRDPNTADWSPANTFTDLDASFYKGSVPVARVARRVSLDTDTGLLSVASTTHKDGDLNTGLTSVSVSPATNDYSRTVTFTYSDGLASYTVSQVVSSQSFVDESATYPYPLTDDPTLNGSKGSAATDSWDFTITGPATVGGIGEGRSGDNALSATSTGTATVLFTQNFTNVADLAAILSEDSVIDFALIAKGTGTALVGIRINVIDSLGATVETLYSGGYAKPDISIANTDYREFNSRIIYTHADISGGTPPYRAQFVIECALNGIASVTIDEFRNRTLFVAGGGLKAGLVPPTDSVAGKLLNDGGEYTSQVSEKSSNLAGDVTGLQVKHADQLDYDVGLAFMPHVTASGALTVSRLHCHKQIRVTGTSGAITFPVDANIPVGAVGWVKNLAGGDKTIAEGAGMEIEFMDGEGGQTGDRTLGDRGWLVWDKVESDKIEITGSGIS